MNRSLALPASSERLRFNGWEQPATPSVSDRTVPQLRTRGQSSFRHPPPGATRPAPSRRGSRCAFRLLVATVATEAAVPMASSSTVQAESSDAAAAAVHLREKRRRSRSELPPGYTHLIVLVHGLAGDANDWAALCEEARASQALPHAWFHSSLVNERQRTIEGIDTCGERLVGELMGLVERSTDLTHISFVGHSMGGLISRYVVGKLYDESSRTILGLKPAHFVTMATPHLGVDGNGLTQVPLLGWAGDVPFIGSSIQKLMISMACPVTSMLFGKSGQQFFLQDGSAPGQYTEGARRRRPLIEAMAYDNSEEGPFLSALKAFSSLTAYANVSGDHLVSWANSSLRFQKELPPIDSFVEGDLVSIRTSRPEPVSSRDGKGGRNYSREGGGRVVGGSPQPKKEIRAQPIAKSASEPDFTSLPTGDSERVHVMLCQLQSLPWTRVDVLIKDRISPFLAHNHIQVTSRLVNHVGLPICRHLLDHLKAMEFASQAKVSRG